MALLPQFPALLAAFGAGCGLVGQQLQFMPYSARMAASYLPVQRAVFGGFAGGDFDGDGRRDVIVCDTTGGTVFFASGTQWSLPGVLSSQQPLARDLDGDGDLDLVLHGPLRPLKVLRNDAGTFVDIALPTPIAGALLNSVVVGDVDADGDEDLVLSANFGSGEMLVAARNVGAMQFTYDATAFPLPVGLLPQIVALIDFDRDGALDVFSVAVLQPPALLRNVGGQFLDATNLLPSMRPGVRALCTGDYDGDGYGDIACCMVSDIDMLWGTGTTFVYQQGAVLRESTQRPEVVDFDGDGDLDLIGLDSLKLLRNVGPRQFSAGRLVDEPINAAGIDDHNGDGLPDIWFTSQANPRQVRFWLGGAGERLDAAQVVGARWPAGDRPMSLPVAGDIDGDGRTDLLIPTSSGLAVNHAGGDGGFRLTMTADPFVVSATSVTPLLADLDNDGDLDLVLASDTRLRTYRNDGRGSFQRVLDASMTAPGVDDTRVADVDGDGDLDLVRAAATGVLLLRNLGSGTFAAPVTIAVGAAALPCVELLDLDGDGDLDLVANIPVGAGHTILANDGLGNFGQNPSFAIDLGASSSSLGLADIDLDGDADLVVGGVPLRLLRNDGNGAFVDVSATQLPANGIGTQAVAAADFDADGDVDVMAVTSFSASVVFLANDGVGTFTARSQQRVARLNMDAGMAWKMFVADVDDDGDLDVLLGAGLVFSGNNPIAIANNLRQCRSIAPPRIGGAAELLILNGPGFGQPGVAAVAVSFARATVPLALPGVAGKLQLDPSTLQVAAAVPLSAIGVSSAFLSVPAVPQLIGQEVWCQAAILPFAGSPGLTNATYEVILH